MPSLAESLAQLNHQSAQIQHLSTHNARPAGPFVQAYLHIPTSSISSSSRHKAGTVLDLIRDAQESEIRLFKYIGETEGSGEKRVEKREGLLITPLREMRGKVKDWSDGRDEVYILLKTALKLVDDYRPMPRARAHITSLLDAHQRQVERVAELERLIAEAQIPSTKPRQRPESSRRSFPSAKPPLTPDEAIKAEEAALKILEAAILPIHQTNTNNLPPAQSPLRSPTAFTPSSEVHTPVKTPMPHITNSLVNGATPRTLNRFSPMRFLGTPRAPVAMPSRLKSSMMGGEDDERRTIFAKTGLQRSTSSNSRSQSGLPIVIGTESNQEQGNDEDAGGENETVRLAPTPASVHTQPSSEPLETPNSPETVADEISVEVAARPAVETGPQKVEGVEVDLETVKSAVERVWTTVGEMMRQGVTDGKLVDTGTEESIKHLHRLSQSDPPPPPSPSSASTTSHLTAASFAKAKPITAEMILLSSLILVLLRVATASEPDISMPMQEVKDTIAAMVRARGWERELEAAEGLSNRTIYGAMGKKVIRIDRRGGGMGRVRFAE